MSNYDSTQAGINHELLEACRGDYRKIGNEIKMEIKKLSEADYKVFIKAFRKEKDKGYETHPNLIAGNMQLMLRKKMKGT